MAKLMVTEGLTSKSITGARTDKSVTTMTRSLAWFARLRLFERNESEKRR